MGIPKGSVSLKAVRADLDLPANGGMVERAVRNKTQQNSGSVSLSQNSGNILGIQYDTYNPSYGSAWTVRNRTSGHGYLTNQVSISTDGTRVFIPCRDNYSDDVGVEARCNGIVAESGSHVLAGSTFGEYDTRYYNGEIHIVLVTNSAGYLQGAQNLAHETYLNSTWGKGEKTHSFNVNLSTSLPYITLTFRNIHKSGGAGALTTHHFWNWTLRKT
jgi:hypothetical protein